MDKLVIRESQNKLLVKEGSSNLIVKQIGSKGEKGDQGLPGASTDIKTYQVGNVLGIGGLRAVYLDSNGQLQYSTSEDIIIANKTIGITLNSAVYLDYCNVKLFGEIEDPSFVFQIDKPIYLYNNGIIGQTYNPNNQCCKILGYATKTNQFYITIQPTIGL